MGGEEERRGWKERRKGGREKDRKGKKDLSNQPSNGGVGGRHGLTLVTLPPLSRLPPRRAAWWWLPSGASQRGLSELKMQSEETQPLFL